MSLFSRITTWVSGQTLTASALNGEFDNLVNGLNNLDSASSTWTNVKTATLTVTGTSNILPAGMIMAYGAASAPSGFLLCDGTAVSRTTYAALFGIIATNFGQGDNSTTFNVPDLRGRFIRGVDSSASRDPDSASRTAMATGGLTGNNVGSVQADAFKSHTHTATDSGHGHNLRGYNLNTSSNAVCLGANTADVITGGSDHGGSEAYVTNNHSGTAYVQNGTANVTNTSSGGNESRPLNAYCWYIIKT